MTWVKYNSNCTEIEREHGYTTIQGIRSHGCDLLNYTILFVL